MTINKEDKKLEEIKKEFKRTLDPDQASKEKSKKSAATYLVEMIENNKEIVLFHDESKNPHVRLPMDGHFEIWPCRSKPFKRWAGRLFWENRAKAINSDALNNALNIIEGKACFEGEQITLSNRVCWHDDAIWYDLSDAEWQAIRIDQLGWSIVKNPPILFKRYSHQQAQIMPEVGGNVEKIIDFANIADPPKRLLFLVFIITCFVPDFPHTVLNIYGPAGSAKTSLSALLKKIIDPSSIEEDELPRSTAEFAQKFSHNWLPCFGNVSDIPGWISDLLCKAITGGGFSKRELYTDDDDIIYKFKRCIVINGISLVAAKSDLLERSILLELETIPANQRLREDVIVKKFEAEKALILGSIFTAVSNAMKIKNEIELDSLPRMADFTIWGCAIAEAIGHSKYEFLQAYYTNINMQNNEVIFESPEAGALVELVEKNSEWKGTATQLLNELQSIAREQKVDIDKNFAKNPNVLTRRLNLLKANLEQAGIKIRRGEENKQRVIYIQKIQENIVSIDEPADTCLGRRDDKNDRDDIYDSILEDHTSTVDT